MNAQPILWPESDPDTIERTDATGTTWRQNTLDLMEERDTMTQDTATRLQIWQHRTSGERYIVLVNTHTSEILEAAGPLHHSDISTALAGDYNADPELVEELGYEPDAYRLVHIQ